MVGGGFGAVVGGGGGGCVVAGGCVVTGAGGAVEGGGAGAAVLGGGAGAAVDGVGVGVGFGVGVGVGVGAAVGVGVGVGVGCPGAAAVVAVGLLAGGVVMPGFGPAGAAVTPGPSEAVTVVGVPAATAAGVLSVVRPGSEVAATAFGSSGGATAVVLVSAAADESGTIVVGTIVVGTLSVPDPVSPVGTGSGGGVGFFAGAAPLADIGPMIGISAPKPAVAASPSITRARRAGWGRRRTFRRFDRFDGALATAGMLPSDAVRDCAGGAAINSTRLTAIVGGDIGGGGAAGDGRLPAVAASADGARRAISRATRCSGVRSLIIAPFGFSGRCPRARR